MDADKTISEWIDEVEEFVCSHPGNCRALRLECRNDELLNPYWLVEWVSHSGTYVRVANGDTLQQALKRFYTNP